MLKGARIIWPQMNRDKRGLGETPGLDLPVNSPGILHDFQSAKAHDPYCIAWAQHFRRGKFRAWVEVGKARVDMDASGRATVHAYYDRTVIGDNGDAAHGPGADEEA